MKRGIHSEYHAIKVSCTCGDEFETRSTIEGDRLRVDVCSACRPFYTDKQKILGTDGRVAKFGARHDRRKAK